MLKNIIISLLVCSLSSVCAQETFVRTYDFEVNVRSSTIKSHKNRFYTLSHQICENECTFLAELNSHGDTLWTKLLPDVDGAPNTIVIFNDTITVTGNNDPVNTAWRMAHFTLDGEKIGETIEIEHPTRKFTHMFQLTTLYFNNRFVICGAGWEGDTAWSLIYVVDKAGHLDTLITLNPTDRDSDIWDSYIDSQGRLTTYHWVEYNNSTVNYRKIYKFNTNYDTVWTYRSENTDGNDVVPRGCVLHDGRTILSYTNPSQISSRHSVRAIRPDGIKDWQHNYPITPYNGRYILRLKTLRNGDIMGSGNYSERLNDPRIDDSPWLFRMNPEGELLWERTYFDFDSTIGSNGSSRIGAIYDFIELEDGDIMAVGDFLYDLQSDMLVMRVDSNGCLDPEDCHEVNILEPEDIMTSTQDIHDATASLFLYPNPASDLINIEFETSTYLLNIEVRDVAGHVVTSDVLNAGRGRVNVSLLQKGLYLVALRDHQGHVVGAGRFVKVGE